MKTLTTLEELLNAATPGKWRNDTGLSYFDRYGQNFCGYFFRATPSPYILGATFDAENTVSLDDAKRNAELICEMKNHLPALIAAARALEDLVEYAAVYANPEEIGVDPARLDAARTALAKLETLK